MNGIKLRGSGVRVRMRTWSISIQGARVDDAGAQMDATAGYVVALYELKNKLLRC